MPSNNPFENFSFGPVEGGTQAGIDRVNANQPMDSNIIAYRDANGRAVLTNTAQKLVNPGESDEEKLQRLFRPTPLTPDENGYIGVKPTEQHPEVPALMQKLGIKPDGADQPESTTPQPQQQQTFVANPNIPLDMHKAFEQLQKSEDLGTARSLFNNIQQSLVDEVAKIRQEAFKFAENKLGLPELRRQLEAARQGDRASYGWHPELGDSPVTQKILGIISTREQQADNEAQNFLKQNSTALRLEQFSTSVQETMKRIETETERRRARKEAVADQREGARLQATFLNNQRDADRREREEERWLTAYEGLSSAQRQRIEILSQDDVLRVNQEYPSDPSNPNPENEKKRKIKLAQIVNGQGKNKEYQAAIHAADTAALLGLSISGNSWARKALLHEESAATGMSVQELDEHLKAAEREFMSKGAMQRMIARREADPAKARQLQAQLMMDSKSYEPETAAKASRTKALLMLDWMSERKTEMFKNDVSSWNISDHFLSTAIEESKKTAKNTHIENVFAAYVKDSTGDARRDKIIEFNSLMRLAVAKHRNSQFGIPNEMELNRYITDKVIGNKMMSNMLAQRIDSPFGLN